MNTIRAGSTLAAFALAFCPPLGVAADKHDHHGSHGGQVRETASYDLELAAKEKQLSLYVRDHAGKKLDMKAATGTAVVMTGMSKETVNLAPAGDNVLKGSAAAAIAADSKILVSVTVGGKTEQARFTPMEKGKPDAHKGHKH